jgi:hypothetical protein
MTIPGLLICDLLFVVYFCFYLNRGEERDLFVFILSVLSYHRMPMSINNVSV